MSAIDSRDPIFSISRSAVHAQTSGVAQPLNAAPDSDGDADRDAAAGVVGQGRPGGLLQGMLQSLDRLGLNASNQINPNADAAATETGQDQEPGTGRQEFQGFAQSLLQTLDQLNRDRTGGTAVAATEKGASDAAYGAESPYGDLAANLQSLADVLAKGDTAALPAATDLQSSFQNLVSRLSQGAGAGGTAPPGTGTPQGDELRPQLASFLASLGEALADPRGTADLRAGTTGQLIDQTV